MSKWKTPKQATMFSMTVTSRAFSPQVRSYIGYFLALVVVAIIYFLIRAYGDTLSAPAPLQPATGSVATIHVNDFLHVLLALALVIATARGLGSLFRMIHQPPVVGEMIAGILLGPSLLGQIAPSFSAYILPHSVAPLLNVISQMGVILYMFLVGLELDLSMLRTRAHSTVAISHASIVVPFLLGAGLALVLYPRLSTSDVSFTAFSLFLGASMSVTAFPVLARILTDRRIHKTKMGTLTLACAAIDDVSAWCLLAFVVSVTQSRAGGAFRTILLALVYIAAMVFLVRPIIARLSHTLDSKGRLTQGILALVLLAILLSSLATESIGIHAIFGAFVLGAIIPPSSSIARDLTEKLEDFVVVFLLPAFFAFTGLRTQIGLVSGRQQWIFCGVIILIASLGKFGGSAVAARLSGLGWRESSALGVLMNTRGLMELIVLNIGLELHVISPTLFAMLVLMALATTFATTPILHFIMPRRYLEKEAVAIEEASRMAAAASERLGILVPVSHPSGVANLLNIALTMNSSAAPPPRVLALVRSAESSVRSRLGETEELLAPSRSPALATALDLAWSRGTVVTPQAVWTTDPVRDILYAAEKSNVRWLLLESRRSLFGGYSQRGVVSRVLEQAKALPINVAVLLGGLLPGQTPLVCLLDTSKDGRAAWELANQMARGWGKPLKAVLLADENTEGTLAAMVRESEKALATGVETLPFASSEEQDFADLVPKGLIIVGKSIADQLQIISDKLIRDRSLIVVQGAGSEDRTVALNSAQLQSVPA
jgi:Kef-type K+ transport system membrane component KefB